MEDFVKMSREEFGIMADKSVHMYLFSGNYRAASGRKYAGCFGHVSDVGVKGQWVRTGRGMQSDIEERYTESAGLYLATLRSILPLPHLP
jgi:hypothetical protein